MKKRILLATLLLSLSLFAFNQTALAEEDDPGDQGQNPVAAYLAGLTGMTYDDLVTLQQDGNGLGNIGRAYLFSQETGMSLEDVLTAAKEEGWGNLYKEAGLHPGGNGLGSLIHTGEDGTKQPGPPPWAGGPNASEDGPGNSGGNSNQNKGSDD